MEPPPATRKPSTSRQGQTYNDKYVVVYNYEDVDPDVASKEITILTQDLESVGLQTEVRPGRDQTLLVFVKAPRNILGSYVYDSRLKDWLYGIVQRHPGGSKNTAVDGAFEAEDVLSVYHLVNWPKSNGGAGITPKWGQWEHVESIFPLHNEPANLSLLRRLNSRFFLTDSDFDEIRNLFGSKVAFYFAFIQTYLVFLIFPAATGLLAWLFLPAYSPTYAVLTTVWCTVFLEYWKIRQVDLSIRWDVKGVGVVKVTRPQFRWERIVVDSAGRRMHYFPKWKQVARQLLQIPFMVVATFALGVIILGVFALETLISDGYSGPYKDAIEYVPTVLLGIALPRINNQLESIATFLTDFENHRTADYYDMSRTQKLFFLQIITNYLPIFLTAFLYVPFGEQMIPWLESLARTLGGARVSRYLGQAQTAHHEVDSDRLRTEIMALTVTGQLSSFFEENLLPILKRRFLEWYRGNNKFGHYYYHHYFSNNKNNLKFPSVAAVVNNNDNNYNNNYNNDDPNELAFLESARRQASLEPYNVQDDIAEIVLQFGFLALFSPVWPLISIGFVVNNVIELRTDFLKLTREHQRPAPIRTDGIGPWIVSLDCLAWAGSISTAAIVHLYSSSSISTSTSSPPPSNTNTTNNNNNTIGDVWWTTLPLTILVSEHIFLALRALAHFVLDRVVGGSSEHIRRQRDEQYLSRVKHLEEMEANRRANMSLNVLAPAERERSRSIRATGSDAFFAKQVEEGASARVGIGLMQAFRSTGPSISSGSRKAGGGGGGEGGKVVGDLQQQPKLD
ncbi:calcium-activated chloride channel-domain-containing protein [Chaetomium strumarium]|uniref:Calcium-activated chloride channel-domain-containing protein n=1 Tax=Chaetomium strumarium TaxID=1170767 RepID=A0AAJ0GX99_9PEZI|nr:calcium-activated chloride channel-domain-containing protein [Chaetomium strumarium]